MTPLWWFVLGIAAINVAVPLIGLRLNTIRRRNANPANCRSGGMIAGSTKPKGGDVVNVRFGVIEAGYGDCFVGYPLSGGPVMSVPLSDVVAVEPAPLEDGDRVRLADNTAVVGEILRIRGSAAIVLWDIGQVSDACPIEMLIRA